jgi:hypothetical protein
MSRDKNHQSLTVDSPPRARPLFISTEPSSDTEITVNGSQQDLPDKSTQAIALGSLKSRIKLQKWRILKEQARETLAKKSIEANGSALLLFVVLEGLVFFFLIGFFKKQAPLLFGNPIIICC